MTNVSSLQDIRGRGLSLILGRTALAQSCLLNEFWGAELK